MAVAFARIGIYQYATSDVFWNPKVIVGNAYAPFYRVNSVFYDPSVYGRFLVRRDPRCPGDGAATTATARRHTRPLAAIAVIWVGLLFSFSQSSFAALMVGRRSSPPSRWRWRAALALGIASAVIARRRARHASHPPLAAARIGNRPEPGIERARQAGHERDQDRAPPPRRRGSGSAGSSAPTPTGSGSRGGSPRRPPRTTRPSRSPRRRALPGLVLLVWLVGVALFDGPASRQRPRSRAGPALDDRRRRRGDRAAQPSSTTRCSRIRCSGRCSV